MTFLEMKNITKKFQHVVANDKVNFSLKKGEIHIILGQNGAGKSTLINILSGVYSPDSGEISICNKKVSIKNPKNALDLGIGVVYQHFHLSSKNTVFENIILNNKDCGFFIKKNKLEKKILKIMEKNNLFVPLDSKIHNLNVADQQKVEIVKVLFNGARILILDEPSAILSPLETKKLHKTIIDLKNQGHSIVIITHKLDEVLELGDRVTVFKKGKDIANLEVSKTNKSILTNLLVDNDFKKNNPSKTTSKHNHPILETKNLTVIDENGVTRLNNLNLTLNKQEILGIAGVSGQGQIELAKAIYGLQKFEGIITINDKSYTNRTPKDSIKEKIAYIPADRLKTGIAASLSICDNLIMKSDILSNAFGIIDRKKVNSFSNNLIKKYNIDGDLEVISGNLSGGNIQKVISARELSINPEIVIASYPMRGLDIPSCEFIKKILIGMRNSGSAIILISEEMNELLEISDRIAVFLSGSLNGLEPVSKIDKIWIGKRMTDVSCQTNYET